MTYCAQDNIWMTQNCEALTYLKWYTTVKYLNQPGFWLRFGGGDDTLGLLPFLPHTNSILCIFSNKHAGVYFWFSVSKFSFFTPSSMYCTVKCMFQYKFEGLFFSAMLTSIPIFSTFIWWLHVAPCSFAVPTFIEASIVVENGSNLQVFVEIIYEF